MKPLPGAARGCEIIRWISPKLKSLNHASPNLPTEMQHCELACPRQANAANGWHVRISIPPNRHDEAFPLTSMTATLFLKPGGHFPKGQAYNDSGTQLASSSYTRAHTPFEGVEDCA